MSTISPASWERAAKLQREIIESDYCSDYIDTLVDESSEVLRALALHAHPGVSNLAEEAMDRIELEHQAATIEQESVEYELMVDEAWRSRRG